MVSPMNRKYWPVILRCAPAATSLIVCSLILFFGVKAYSVETDILNHGSRAPGTVTAEESWANVASGQEEYSITYSFSLSSDKSLTGQAEVDWAMWKEIRIGDPIDIAFDQKSPEKNIPANVDQTGKVVLTLIFAVIFPAVIFYVLRKVLPKPTATP